jgi:hypothetical protein
MINYEKFLESILDRKQRLSLMLERLGSFLYLESGLGLKNIIIEILSTVSQKKDFNAEYQIPLEILSKTRRFNDIKFINGKWYSERLANFHKVLDDEGKWHPVNKLCTNYSDLAELLSDLFEKIGILDNVFDIYGQENLKKYLKDFSSKNNLKELIQNYIGVEELKKYIKKNRKYSETGEKAEKMVVEFLKSEKRKMEILHEGGDGDLIDMLYGVDIIAGKDSNIYLIQVKSKVIDAKKAFQESISGKRYYNIDWFCAPYYDGSVVFFTNKYPDGKYYKS